MNADNLAVDLHKPGQDFSVFLHELRTRYVRSMPQGAETFLSGGCAGTWYFHWIRENYPGRLKKHVGVEAYSPKPSDLPPEVEWIANLLGNMRDVPETSVDLVFAGETVEHVWPADLANFLAESHRVLRPGGSIVLDSPNRLMTHPLNWIQGQHTVELTLEEILELLDLAGYDEPNVKGMWLCYDREKHKMLGLVPNASGTDVAWRVTAAVDRPEDSFIWWVDAKKANRKPNIAALRQKTKAIYDAVWPIVASRFSSHVGYVSGTGRERIVQTTAGQTGCLVEGPYLPYLAGNYVARFVVGIPEALPTGVNATDNVGALQVFAALDNRLIAEKALTAGELTPGKMFELTMEYALTQTEFGVVFRVCSNGRVALATRLHVEHMACENSPACLAAENYPGPGPLSYPLRYRLALRFADGLNSALKWAKPVHWLLKNAVRPAA